ncbi:hypothetical protein Tco_1427851 [Tanacetum coccineum]
MTQDKAKQVVCDEKLAPSYDKVRIGISNLRIAPPMTQREETFQVALDILKNTPFYNAFLISADVPEIHMQQFWFTIEKVKKSSSYQFDIDRKTCQIDVDIFRKILDISLKVENKEFTKPPSSDELREFRRELGYKGMYHEANVDYAAMMWEDLQYQIDYRQTKMYFKYSTSLISLKKSRGRVVKKTTATIQMPTKPKKKPSKKKQVLRDESPESEGEPKNWHLELATQKAIKDIQRTSRLKHKTGSSSEGIGVSPGVLDELTGVSAVSSEGVGTSPKVLDETLYDYEAQSDDDVWGSTDEETNKDGDEDDVNEEEEDEEESVDEEESFNEKENVDEENEEESDDDDRSFDITNTDIVAETEEEENADSKHEEDDTKGEDQKHEEEPKGDDQAKKGEVGVPDLVTNKEKSEFLQSTSSHSISSNFGNQFLVNSPNASLIGTIPENIDKEITFMMDIVIQQDVPLVQNEPFHEVKVSVIPEPTQQPPSTPPLPAKEDPTALVINFEAVDSFFHKFNALENDIQELKQADHFAAILESIRSQLKNEVSVKKEEYKDFIQETVANEVKNQLSQILPKGKSLTEFELKKILIEKMKRSQSYQTADQHKILYNGLVKSYLLDKDLFELYGQTVSLKRNHEEDKDEDASARPNQGKETKKQRTRKETESSKKSSTPKESTKGKPPSKSSKTGQSAHADQSAKEPEHEIPNQGFQSQTGSLNLQDLRHLNQIRTLSRPLMMLQNSHSLMR